MKDPIKKLSKKATLGELAEIPTTSFRETGELIVGELDTATSFMYLFRRFGTPTYANADEYKILYEYRLKYKDIVVAIHASYHEHVYFNAWMPKEYEDKRREEYIAYVRQIATESVKNGVCYMPYTGPNSHILTDKLLEDHNKLYDAEARKHFSPEEYDFLCNFHCEEGDLVAFRPYYDKIEPFNRMLCKKFRDTLSEEDLNMYNDGCHIKHYPIIKQQVEEFFIELMQGMYVRDVAINIRGYEGKENAMAIMGEEADE